VRESSRSRRRGGARAGETPDAEDTGDEHSRHRAGGSGRRARGRARLDARFRAASAGGRDDQALSRTRGGGNAGSTRRPLGARSASRAATGRVFRSGCARLAAGATTDAPDAGTCDTEDRVPREQDPAPQLARRAPASGSGRGLASRTATGPGPESRVETRAASLPDELGKHEQFARTRSRPRQQQSCMRHGFGSAGESESCFPAIDRASGAGPRASALAASRSPQQSKRKRKRRLSRVRIIDARRRRRAAPDCAGVDPRRKHRPAPGPPPRRNSYADRRDRAPGTRDPVDTGRSAAALGRFLPFDFPIRPGRPGRPRSSGLPRTPEPGLSRWRGTCNARPGPGQGVRKGKPWEKRR
jgi:hypothetical protein